MNKDIHVNLAQAAEYLETYKAKVIRLIAQGEIDGHAVKANKKPQWKISFRSLKKWRKENP